MTAGLVAVNVTMGQSTAKADVGVGMELDVITAVVLGGTSIFGGATRTHYRDGAWRCSDTRDPAIRESPLRSG